MPHLEGVRALDLAATDRLQHAEPFLDRVRRLAFGVEFAQPEMRNGWPDRLRCRRSYRGGR